MGCGFPPEKSEASGVIQRGADILCQEGKARAVHNRYTANRQPGLRSWPRVRPKPLRGAVGEAVPAGAQGVEPVPGVCTFFTASWWVGRYTSM
jgi:hypothetical protein